MTGTEPLTRLAADPFIGRVSRSELGKPVSLDAGRLIGLFEHFYEDNVFSEEFGTHYIAAAYGGFACCDSGMIPWLLVLELMSSTGKPLSALVEERMRQFPASGEINRWVADVDAVILNMKNSYQANTLAVDHTDGLSMEFSDCASTCAVRMPNRRCGSMWSCGGAKGKK